jgi:hypothetical protein
MNGIKAARASLCLLLAIAASAQVAAQDDPPASDTYRQSREDAWWTGPILAAGANTLPKGHTLIEPYVFDSISRGRYDDDGKRQDTPRRHSHGSLTYMLYGLVDDFTVGVIPRFGYNDVSDGLDSSGIRPGDFSIQGTYRLMQFREGSRTPTMSVVLQETLPTGQYEKLGDRPADGLGSGAYTTTLSLNSQYFLWMPNGRIVRTRLNLSYSMSDIVSIEDVSVYGTSNGFRGRAKPGRSFIVDSAWEYSLTRNWVLALDVAYQHDTSTTLSGFDSQAARIEKDFGSSEVFTLAPAVEFNWSGKMGVIVGSVLTVAGRNTSASIAPVMAVNMVF